MTSILSKNLSEAEASQLADYFVWAETSGNETQGIVKFIGTNPVQEIIPEGPIEIERESAVSARMNAHKNPSPLASVLATDKAIELAHKSGVGVVGLHGIFSSNGAQAYYAEKVAEQGLIGFCCSRSPAAASGFGTIDPIFGTNPIGFSFPTTEGPIVFDMATSAMTFYGLVLAAAEGRSISEGLALDHEGTPTVNPRDAMKGSILPFDKSYKGSNLAMMVELLAGPLAGSAWVDNKTFKEEWGALFIAIDPNVLVDRKEFIDNATDMIAKIRSTRTGSSGLRLPGDRSKALRLRAKETGFIDISDAVAENIGLEP